MELKNVKVDKENMCIDRSTKLGQDFDAFNKMVLAQEDPKFRAFMSTLSGYTEAGMVITSMYDGEQRNEKMGQLLKKFDQACD